MGEGGGEWNAGGENESTGELVQLSLPVDGWLLSSDNFLGLMGGDLELSVFLGLQAPLLSLGVGEDAELSCSSDPSLPSF